MPKKGERKVQRGEIMATLEEKRIAEEKAEEWLEAFPEEGLPVPYKVKQLDFEDALIFDKTSRKLGGLMEEWFAEMEQMGGLSRREAVMKYPRLAARKLRKDLADNPDFPYDEETLFANCLKT